MAEEFPKYYTKIDMLAKKLGVERPDLSPKDILVHALSTYVRDFAGDHASTTRGERLQDFNVMRVALSDNTFPKDAVQTLFKGLFVVTGFHHGPDYVEQTVVDEGIWQGTIKKLEELPLSAEDLKSLHNTVFGLGRLIDQCLDDKDASVRYIINLCCLRQLFKVALFVSGVTTEFVFE